MVERLLPHPRGTLLGQHRGRLLLSLAIFLTICLFLRPARQLPTAHTAHTAHPTRPSKTFVVASLRSENTSWISKSLPDWELRRYVVDDSDAEYTVPKNKGHESMVYLTYIIDEYDRLPDLTVFMHAQRYQWHNDDPLYDGVPLLQNLQLPYLLSAGYTNLRCVWLLGCPAELKLEAHGGGTQASERAYPSAFKTLFPSAPLPSVVGVACCAQFAVTRATIQRHPRKEYIRWRQWLLDTDLPDDVNGRIFEYSWHFIFGRGYVHCPNAGQCYQDVYGLELDCEGQEGCGQRWAYPPSATLPTGWPEFGWKGERRDQATLDAMRREALHGKRAG